jgi:hypothetical protein
LPRGYIAREGGCATEHATHIGFAAGEFLEKIILLIEFKIKNPARLKVLRWA